MLVFQRQALFAVAIDRFSCAPHFFLAPVMRGHVLPEPTLVARWPLFAVDRGGFDGAAAQEAPDSEHAAALGNAGPVAFLDTT